MTDIVLYSNLLTEIKKRLRQAQAKAIFSANAEMIAMYFDIGKMILEKQKLEGWGSGIIPKLSIDIRNELPEIKGFSERNIGYMIRFAKEYNDLFLQQRVAKMENKKTFFSIPWGHHIILLEKLKDIPARFWYMGQVVLNGWSRETLVSMIKNESHRRQSKLAHNFDDTLPPIQSDLISQTFKDPYVFDFLTLSEHFQERELENELVKHLEKFLIELGAGFAFLGRQYKLTVAEQDFYLDLLFYHIKLRCFVVIELKKGEFKPEHAGKMNFYCSAVDDQLKQPTDKATIGLILCETKNKIFAEYSLRDIHKPIGVSEYELTRALPDNLKSSLPSIEEIETALSENIQ